MQFSFVLSFVLAVSLLLVLPALSSSPILTFGTLSPPLVTPHGVHTDRFAISSPGEFFGLAFFGGDEGYSATQFYSIREAANLVSYFDTITATTSTVTDRFDASTTAATNNIFSLAFAAPDLGYGSDIFYYLRTDTTQNDKSVFGTLTPGGVVGVSADLIVANMTTNFDALTFAAANVGQGANMFYYIRHDAGTCLSHFGVIDLTTLTRADIMTLGVNFDALFFTELDVGFGANMFYYLRHSSSDISTFGTLDPVNKIVSDKYTLGKNYNQLAFTATDVAFGPNFFYYIRGAPFTCVPRAIKCKKGINYPNNPNNPNNPDGPNGPSGPTGNSECSGPNGPDNPNGPSNRDGPTGPTNKKGKTGETGKTNKSH